MSRLMTERMEGLGVESCFVVKLKKKDKLAFIQRGVEG